MLSWDLAGSSASSPLPACDAEAPSTMRRLLLRAAAVAGLAIGAWVLCSLFATTHASADSRPAAPAKPAAATSTPDTSKQQPAAALAKVLTKVLTDTTGVLTHSAPVGSAHQTHAAAHGAAAGATHGTSVTGQPSTSATTNHTQHVDPVSAVLTQVQPISAPVTTAIDGTLQTVTDVTRQLLQPALGPVQVEPTLPPVGSVPSNACGPVRAGHLPSAAAAATAPASAAGRVSFLPRFASRPLPGRADPARIAQQTPTGATSHTTTPLGHGPNRTPFPAPSNPAPVPAPSGSTGGSSPAHAALPETSQLVPASAAQPRPVRSLDRLTRLRSSEPPVFPD